MKCILIHQVWVTKGTSLRVLSSRLDASGCVVNARDTSALGATWLYRVDSANMGNCRKDMQGHCPILTHVIWVC